MPEKMLIILYLCIMILTFFFMEGVAWFLHKYEMHGFGWFLHEDHHRYTKKRFQKMISTGCFLRYSCSFYFFGFFGGFDIRLFIGIGVAMYGIGYFLVHDTFLHRQNKIEYRPKSKYIKRILHAHAIHHQIITAHTGFCFVFLYATKIRCF